MDFSLEYMLQNWILFKIQSLRFSIRIYGANKCLLQPCKLAKKYFSGGGRIFACPPASSTIKVYYRVIVFCTSSLVSYLTWRGCEIDVLVRVERLWQMSSFLWSVRHLYSKNWNMLTLKYMHFIFINNRLNTSGKSFLVS